MKTRRNIPPTSQPILERPATSTGPVSRLPAFKVIAKTRGFRTGVDLLRLNQLYDELEIEDSQRTMEAGKNRQ
jgi:hypothetical protein